jgi:hypothetical protein
MLNYRTVLLEQTGICSWDSSDGIEYTTSVIGFINKCLDNVVPTLTVRTYQKPWITVNIRSEIEGRGATFKEWDSNPDTLFISPLFNQESSWEQVLIYNCDLAKIKQSSATQTTELHME